MRRLLAVFTVAVLGAACGGGLAARDVKLHDGRHVQCVVGKDDNGDPVAVECDFGGAR